MPSIASHDQQWETNPRPLDLESIILSKGFQPSHLNILLVCITKFLQLTITLCDLRQGARIPLGNKLRAKKNVDLFILSQNYVTYICILTLTVLVSTIDAQWEGMGDVGAARYEPALLPPCPTIRVLRCSN